MAVVIGQSLIVLLFLMFTLIIIIIIIIMAQLGIQQKIDIDAENKINNKLEESFET